VNFYLYEYGQYENFFKLFSYNFTHLKDFLTNFYAALKSSFYPIESDTFTDGLEDSSNSYEFITLEDTTRPSKSKYFTSNQIYSEQSLGDPTNAVVVHSRYKLMSFTPYTIYDASFIGRSRRHEVFRFHKTRMEYFYTEEEEAFQKSYNPAKRFLTRHRFPF